MMSFFLKKKTDLWGVGVNFLKKGGGWEFFYFYLGISLDNFTA
jgi:hypothetical protein